MADLKDKDYWYFRMVRTFFNSDEMRWIKKIPNGYRIIVIYLEICCLSVSRKGYVRIPRTSPLASFASDLALDLGEHESNVVEALKVISSLGLIEVIEDQTAMLAEIHVPVVKENVGVSSREAERKRKQRNRLYENTKLIEEKRIWGNFRNVYLSESEYESFTVSPEKRREVINLVSRFKKINNINDKENDLERCYKFMEG